MTVRSTLDNELRRIQDDVLVLGSMVEIALVESVEILKRRDMEAARHLIAQDRAINDKRFAIEHDALTLIATQQPVARDMRTLAAVLEITTELERMGDYAKGIAKITLLLGEEALLKPLTYLPLMAEKTCNMLHRALDAFVRGDIALARVISEQDEYVDDLYNRVYRESVAHIISDPNAIDWANYLMWAAHNLERAADRVINICERVVFTVTGKMVEMDTEDEAALPERLAEPTG